LLSMNTSPTIERKIQEIRALALSREVEKFIDIYYDSK